MSYRIGIFGIGTMGLPISCNFRADGNQVTGYDINPKAVAAMKENGMMVKTESLPARVKAKQSLTFPRATRMRLRNLVNV